MEINPQIADGHTDGDLSPGTKKYHNHQITCLDDHEAEVILLRMQNHKLQQQLDGSLFKKSFYKAYSITINPEARRIYENN